MKNINNIIVNENATIKDTLEIISNGSMRIALVMKDCKLIGIINDTDIRKAFLKGFVIADPITEIINRDPIVCHVNDTKDKILDIAIAKKVYEIPIVDDDGNIVGIDELDELLKTEKQKNKVVLMVGGLGTRLRPLTQDTPKPLLKVGGKPILETIVENFSKYGFKDFIFSVNYKSEMIENYFGDGSKFGVNIEYIHEDNRMGTAGALSLMKSKLDSNFFVMNGDVLTNVNFEHLKDFHEKSETVATMCVREYEYQIPYGVVNVDGSKIVSIEEKPTSKYFVNAGIYMLSPEVLEYIPEKEFFDMPTLFERLMEEDYNTISFPVREYWLDIGHMDAYHQANDEYGEVF